MPAAMFFTQSPVKKFRIPHASKTMAYFGRRTEKDDSVFGLSQAPNAWSQAPSPAYRTPSAALTCDHRSASSPPRTLPLPPFVQGDLFALA